MMKSQRGDTEKDKLIEEGKRIGISKIIRQNNGNSQSKKIIFLTHIWMIKVSIKTYAENCTNTVTVNEKGGKNMVWLKVIDIQKKLGVWAIKRKYNTKNPTKEQIRRRKGIYWWLKKNVHSQRACLMK